jgi:hypothetical protein
VRRPRLLRPRPRDESEIEAKKNPLDPRLMDGWRGHPTNRQTQLFDFQFYFSSLRLDSTTLSLSLTSLGRSLARRLCTIGTYMWFPLPFTPPPLLSSARRDIYVSFPSPQSKAKQSISHRPVIVFQYSRTPDHHRAKLPTPFTTNLISIAPPPLPPTPPTPPNSTTTTPTPPKQSGHRYARGPSTRSVLSGSYHSLFVSSLVLFGFVPPLSNIPPLSRPQFKRPVLDLNLNLNLNCPCHISFRAGLPLPARLLACSQSVWARARSLACSLAHSLARFVFLKIHTYISSDRSIVHCILDVIVGWNRKPPPPPYITAYAPFL